MRTTDQIIELAVLGRPVPVAELKACVSLMQSFDHMVVSQMAEIIFGMSQADFNDDMRKNVIAAMQRVLALRNDCYSKPVNEVLGPEHMPGSSETLRRYTLAKTAQGTPIAEGKMQS